MACDTEDCGFQMLNDDEIVTSMQEESDPVDDETDEDEDNNNESSKNPSNTDAFSALETAIEYGHMRDGIRKWEIVNPDDPDQDNGAKLLNYCIVIGPGQVSKVLN
ncbi:hypothetical protein TNCV_4096951 [Trichonephila clavipes]|nr:hypothetical protein TNCV_4096951 [Trichonephila clavipes]